jgi:hypothetical protein
MVNTMPPIARSLAGQPSSEAILAPSALYLTGEEQLRISSIGNAAGVTVMVRGRVLRPGYDIAIIEQPHTPNSNRTIATTTIALSEGWPLGFTVRASVGTPAGGAVWVLLELVRGQGNAAVVVETLGSGFVTANVPLQVPGSTNQAPTDGAGCLRSITGTTPGAGAEISETVPAGARWELLAFRAVLTTSATVAGRWPSLLLDDGANIYTNAGVEDTVAASQTENCSWGQGVSKKASPSLQSEQGSLPVGIRLGSGHRMRTATINLQVGDQYSAVQYLVREWIDV